MTTVLFVGAERWWGRFGESLVEAIAEAGIDATLVRDDSDVDAAAVDYIVSTIASPGFDFGCYPKLRAVFSLWAGVEPMIGNATLNVPLARMVDPAGMTQGMVEYVVGHVMRHHLDLDRHIINNEPVWQPQIPPLASERPVTILGLGELGAACAVALRDLGFPVTGWSRTAKILDGVRCLSGPDGLVDALTSATIVVLLVPATPDTERLIDAERLGLLADGAVVINPGRGVLVDDDDLLEALDAGRLAHATLDVFRVEPLPADHRYWSHPSVTVTPHIASGTRPATAGGGGRGQSSTGDRR